MSSFLSLVRLLWYLTRLGYPLSSERLVNLPDVPKPGELVTWITQEPEEQMDADTDVRPIDALTEKFKEFVTETLEKFQTIGWTTEYHVVAFCPVHNLPIGEDEAWYNRNFPNGATVMTLSPVEVACSCIYISRNLDLDEAILARGIRNIRNLIYERFVKERKLNRATMAQFWAWLIEHDGDGGAADDYWTPSPITTPSPDATQPPVATPPPDAHRAVEETPPLQHRKRAAGAESPPRSPKRTKTGDAQTVGASTIIYTRAYLSSLTVACRIQDRKSVV